MSGYQSVTVQPKLWKNGRHASTVSFVPRFSMSANCETLPRRLRWLSTTPFGSPLEPLVKSTTASSRSPMRGMPSSARQHPRGQSRATTAAPGDDLRLQRRQDGVEVEQVLGHGKSASRFTTAAR